jgi:hypothetical protein
MIIPSNPDFNDAMRLLTEATTAMILRTPVMVTHPPHWKRPDGWPLPIERVKPASDAESFTQGYRPLAVLEWCEYKLAEPERQARAAAAVAGRATQGERE